MEKRKVRLDPFEETASDGANIDDDFKGDTRLDKLGQDDGSNSSNSEKADHTYNPYSFKRL